MKNSETIKEIEKTIKQLSSDPKEADTIKALRKQIESMKPCKHGKYTNTPFNGCKTCGKKYRVICSNENVSPKIRNSGGCNPTNCKYFTAKT